MGMNIYSLLNFYKKKLEKKLKIRNKGIRKNTSSFENLKTKKNGKKGEKKRNI
jgi:hypothetical protein